jgi:hypothetical protein
VEVMLRRLLNAFSWRILSIPIFYKIVGIGLLTAILFGTVTLLQTRASTSQILYQLLEQRTVSIGRSLADAIERPASTGDFFATSLFAIRMARWSPPHLKRAFPRISLRQATKFVRRIALLKLLQAQKVSLWMSGSLWSAAMPETSNWASLIE